MTTVTHFSDLFSAPPAQYHGLDIVHSFRHRRRFRDIWHHLPVDTARTATFVEGKQFADYCYGPHPELDPDKGIRGDLRCILVVAPQIDSTDDLDALVHGGIGGLAGNVAWSPEYPYDAIDWQDFREALEYCRQHGLEMWCYDEAGYPSGHANQRTFEGHPEYVAQGVQWMEVVVEGPDTVAVPFPRGTAYAAVAVAMTAEGLDGGRQIVFPAAGEPGADVQTVQLPAGQWRVFTFTTGPVWEGTHADFLNIHYPNLLDGSAVRRFLDVTHETYWRECSEWFGKTITAFFTDEPSLMAPIVTSPPMDGQVFPNLPWVDDLPTIFQLRAGYPLQEALPALIANVGEQTTKRRCDFWETITHLLSTVCYRQIGDWCTNHGVAYTGHLLHEERIRHHVPLHGDMMECLRWFGWTGYDALFSLLRDEDPHGFAIRTLGAKYASSAAHLFDKPHTMCETFGLTVPRSLETFEHVLDVLVMLGLDRHGYYSILDKLTPEERTQMNTHLGRMALAGTYGRHRCEVAILYPIVAAWAGYDASSPLGAQDVDALDVALIHLSQGILDHQLDFDFCDDRSLQHGYAENGRWVVGKESYRMLVVPPMLAMRRATLDALDRARQAGVEVVFTGEFPEYTAEKGPTPQLPAWCAERFTAPVTTESAPAVISMLTEERPLLAPESQTLWIVHRQGIDELAEWSDLFLIVNTMPTDYDGMLTLPLTGDPHWLDVNTGEITPCQVNHQDNSSTLHIPLKLKGRGVRIIGCTSA